MIACDDNEEQVWLIYERDDKSVLDEHIKRWFLPGRDEWMIVEAEKSDHRLISMTDFQEKYGIWVDMSGICDV